MTTVAIEPDDIARRIREYLLDHPGLIYDEYDNPPGSLNGGCYVAAESYFHAQGGTDSTLDIYCLSWSDVNPEYTGTHWYLRDTSIEAWIDLGFDTIDQAEHIPFSDGTRRAFITGYEPSNRAQTVLDTLNL